MLFEICWASWISFSSDTFLGILPSNSFSLLPQICLQTWANTATVPPHVFIFKTVTSAKVVAHHSKLSESFLTRYSLHWLGRTSLWIGLGRGHESSTRLSHTDSHHFNPTFQQFLKHKPFSDCCMLLVHFQGAEMVDSGRGGGLCCQFCPALCCFLGGKDLTISFYSITAGSCLPVLIHFENKTYTLEDYVRKKCQRWKEEL